ncbi:hypothetical protein ASPZODRAFT_128463 [Penicilliopsis zonata CBS 506.65]|uniref:Uncharacterized protein n=1 Tax=Penicilliopsis zonata CBS 506.65 TaxID=1073090 RepID=A0A1L9SRQ8_9EURO|nr:hypothetical protein ASPZODRAFT_128463 [Penicilliopsis zonata CBS 506.65]OJJ49902.1 hypothetical protein ASPZODRAFT_128463 [Penicilliopsis zonata CBS 506.65]
MSQSQRPVGLLFDIGGVCVVSPFQAILDYEISQGIPPGWINFSISRTSPEGSWHRLERGEIHLDKEFFSAFNKDLQRPALWREFQERLQRNQARGLSTTVPPLPEIDAEYLFWEMMRVSRAPDPYMFPALKKLKESNKFIIGALSNTVIFPDGHPYNEDRDKLVARFDFFLSSAHTGLRKPDPRIYEAAIKEMNQIAKTKGIDAVEASDIVFLDDIGENLKAAKKAGMETIKVTLGKTYDAVKELEKITGLDLLETDKARL